MSGALHFTLVILVYLPGLVALVAWRKCWRFPILFATFLGMLLFNALGSIGVFSEVKIYTLAFDTSEVSETLSLVLVFQALAFYAIAGAYIALRKPLDTQFRHTRIDFLLCAISAGLIVIIAALYYAETGTFLILASLDGSMNVDNALSFRMKYAYGLEHWPFFNIGFVFLPVLLSSYGLIVVKGDRSYWWFFLATAVISMGASLSMGSKAGVVGFVLSLGIAYLTYSGMTGQNILSVLRSRNFFLFFLVSLGILVFGYNHATPEGLSVTVLLERVWYRAFVAYPEALAAAISYVEHYGELGQLAMPTIRGLLSHEQVVISSAIHLYQSGFSGGASVPMAGEAFLFAGWPGVVLILPLIFILLILLQELAFCMTEGVTSIAFSALYAYLALGLSLNGVFSSLINFMYPSTLAFIGLAATAILWGTKMVSSLMLSPKVSLHE